MPLPFILWGAAALAAGVGVKKGLNAMDNNAKAEELVNQSNDFYNTNEQELNAQRQKTSSMLDKLGRTKVETSANEMKDFVDAFRKFKNVNWTGAIGIDNSLGNTNIVDIGKMESEAIQAEEILKGGTGSLAAGALAGIAAYGGVGALAAASTGTAISTLSGVAATNATLAWLGGGSLAAGGFGVAGGTIALGGIVLAPVLAVGGMFLEAKSEENLAKAEEFSQKVYEAVLQMGIIKNTLTGIYNIADDYNEFIIKFNRRFNAAIGYMNSIHARYSDGKGSKVDFNDLEQDEKELLHTSWIMAQTLQGLLKKKLLDSQFKVDYSARELLDTVRIDYRGMGI